MLGTIHRTLCLFLLILIFLIPGQVPFAQKPDRVIELRYERMPRSRDIGLYCRNRSHARYSVFIEFPILFNLRLSNAYPYHFTVEPGTRRLLTITPIDPRRSVNYRMKASYRKGCIEVHPKEEVLYLLPIADGKRAEVEIGTTIARNLENGRTASGLRYIFRVMEGDTIYASRRGIVTELEERNVLSREILIYFPGLNSNYIEIEHEDCTYARYSRVRQDGAFVKPGDVVEAGEPIGIVMGMEADMACDLEFKVYYSTFKPDDRFTRQEYSDDWWHYVEPVFHTVEMEGTLEDGNTYTSSHPLRIVTQEMSRRDMKLWMKRQRGR